MRSLILFASLAPLWAQSIISIPRVNSITEFAPDLNRDWAYEIASDMRGFHEERPHGVDTNSNWSDYPRINPIDKGVPPTGWKALMSWGQVYAAYDGNPAVNARVHIAKIRTAILSKSTGKWTLLQDSDRIQGHAYLESFADDASVNADIRSEAEGGVSVRMIPEHNFHFWIENGRVSIDDADIGGVVTGVLCRLVADNPDQLDDREKARLLISMGADYWTTLTAQWDQWKTNADVGIGKFRFVKKDWQWHWMSTVDEAHLRSNPPPLPADPQVRHHLGLNALQKWDSQAKSDLNGSYFQAVQDGSKLAVRFHVQDDKLVGNGINPWDRDGVHLFLDGGNQRSMAIDSDDRKWNLTIAQQMLFEYKSSALQDVQYAVREGNGSYDAVLVVPLGIRKDSLGLNIQVTDNDRTLSATGWTLWSEGFDIHLHPNFWGIGVLEQLPVRIDREYRARPRFFMKNKGHDLLGRWK